MPDIFLEVLYKVINKPFVNGVCMWLCKGVGTYLQICYGETAEYLKVKC
jgi:hypothetical protein